MTRTSFPSDTPLALVAGWRFVVHEPLIDFRLDARGQARSVATHQGADFVGTQQQANYEAARRTGLFERRTQRAVCHLELQRVALLPSSPSL
jgi:hypothetical protein